MPRLCRFLNIVMAHEVGCTFLQPGRGALNKPVTRHLHAIVSSSGLFGKACLVSVPLNPGVNRPWQAVTMPSSLLVGSRAAMT